MADILLFLTTSVSSHNELKKLDTQQTHAFKASLGGEEDVSPFVVVADIRESQLFCVDDV
jgi:hypothetical protein